MKFKIYKNILNNVLSKIQILAGRKSNLAVTSNVLIKATDAGVTLTVTDLETGFEGFYPAEVEVEGTIAINAKTLYEIIKDFPDKNILINEIKNHWIEIGNEEVEYHIVGMDHEDFPNTPEIKDAVFFNIDSNALKSMIEKILIIGTVADDKRAHLEGVYLEIINNDEEKLVRMVSTDGNRLSTVDYNYKKEDNLPESTGIIIPKKGLGEVNKFLGAENTVQIGFKRNYFIIKKENETIIIRLLEGDFPEYRDVIKKENNHIIKMNKQLFIMMLKRMSILSSENYKGGNFIFGNNKLVVSSINPEIGESKEDMAIDYNKESIEIVFNTKYFIDTMNVIEDEIIILNIIDKEKPCFIEGEKDKNFLSIIMPMRT